MIINLGMKPDLDISGIAKLSIDRLPIELVCMYKDDAFVDKKVRSLDSVIQEIKQTAPRKFFGFSSDRILDAALKYFIIYDPDLKRQGEAGRWLGQEDKLHAKIREKGDNKTLIHELIHLAHGYLYREVMDSPDDIQSTYDFENAIDIASKILLY